MTPLFYLCGQCVNGLCGCNGIIEGEAGRVNTPDVPREPWWVSRFLKQYRDEPILQVQLVLQHLAMTITSRVVWQPKPYKPTRPRPCPACNSRQASRCTLCWPRTRQDLPRLPRCL